MKEKLIGRDVFEQDDDLSEQVFWHRREAWYDAKKQKWIACENTNNLPDIICKCGEMEFLLTYGDYELFATCPKCGRRESVYSG